VVADKALMNLHKHFMLIVLWAMGFEIQEKYYWYRDWADSHGTPDWNDPEAQFRLRFLHHIKVEEVIIALMFIGFLMFLLIGVSYD
jgi:hypothetical protein